MGDDEENTDEPDRPLENASRRTRETLNRRRVRPPETENDGEDEEDG